MTNDSRSDRPSRLALWLRSAPSLRELPSSAGVAAARLLVRRPRSAGRGYASDESPIIITGMHRSGTSIFAQLLEQGGMYLGGSWLDEHHESIYFSRANRAMLGEAPYLLYDYGWTAPKSDEFIEERRGYAERAAKDPARFFAERGDEAVWGWKDPRNCLTLPAWLSIYPNAKVLHLVRDGRAVALSLAERDGLDPAFGLALWAVYVSRAERAMAAVPAARKLTLRYEDLTGEPVQAIDGMLSFTGLQPSQSIEDLTSMVSAEPTGVREADPMFTRIGNHPLLAAYGYR